MELSKDFFEFKNDPVMNFKDLFAFAERVGVPDPIAMNLTTVTADNKPSSRIVLLKEVDKDGNFVFYTNYNSSKSQNMSNNPNVELLFFWQQIYVQIKISGTVTKTSRKVSEAYFKTRPRISQLGAWASYQSELIENYEVLEDRFKKVEEKFKDQEVPCPPHWGGYIVYPEAFEFWFGMEGRLHYRYIYERSGDGGWLRKMKSP